MEIDTIKGEQKPKSVKKNYIYNLIYQLFLVIVPLVVTPYVSRVLQPEGVGAYSFSFSIINYFTIFGALGFGFYAQREIAKVQGNKQEQSKVFWEINICRIFPVVLALVLNVILCFSGLYGKNNTLMWIMNINIFALVFDIAFIYQGNEEFSKLVIRNALVKIVSIVLIFVFVKEQNDLWIYTLINSAMVILSNLIMWMSLPKMLVKVSNTSLKPFSHLKGTLRLFIPTVATSIYTILDKTLIGALISDTYVVIEDGVEIVKSYADLENGYYEQSEKIIKMALTIITSIGTVMIPRNSNEIANNNHEQVKKNLYTSSKLVWLIGIPMVLGFILLSSYIVPWFFGQGYDKCSTLMQIFSVLIIIIGFSNVLGLQYLVPSGQDKKFAIALTLGAIINLILNLILIPFYWSVGATIASIIAELVVTITMFIMSRKYISFTKIILSSWKYLISGAIMFVILYFIKGYFDKTLLHTLLITGIGVLLYFIILIVLKDNLVCDTIKKIINIIKNKLVKN